MLSICTQPPFVLKFGRCPEIFSDMKILKLRYNEYSRYRLFQNDFQSMFSINFLAYTGCGYIPRDFVCHALGTTFIAKTGFSFLTEISRNYANISGHGSNF